MGNSYPVPNGHDPKQPNPVVILVESFIRQYYEWYDNKVSKQCIKNAYCENATFSISADYLSNMYVEEYLFDYKSNDLYYLYI